MNAQHISTPSRRTVVRAAAWTAPAVSVVVAAPAFATSPGATEGTASAAAKGKREAKELYPSATLTAGSTSTLTAISAVVSISVGELDPDYGSANAGWTLSAITATTATFTWNGQLTPGTSVDLAAHLRLTRNVPEIVVATITFTWTGGSSSTTQWLGK